MLTKRQVQELTAAFGMLATPVRLALLDQLAQRRETNVTELCRRLKLGQPAVSHHLGKMRARGLVTARRDGKRTYYAVNRAAFDAPGRFLDQLGTCRAGLRTGKAARRGHPNRGASRLGTPKKGA